MGSGMSKQYIWIFLVGILLISTEVPAQGGGCDASTRDPGAMAADAVLVRPFGVVGTVFGAAAWIVSLPFTLPSGNAGEAGQRMIGDPAAYTFSRPLGSTTRCPKVK